MNWIPPHKRHNEASRLARVYIKAQFSPSENPLMFLCSSASRPGECGGVLSVSRSEWWMRVSGRWKDFRESFAMQSETAEDGNWNAFESAINESNRSSGYLIALFIDFTRRLVRAQELKLANVLKVFVHMSSEKKKQTQAVAKKSVCKTTMTHIERNASHFRHWNWKSRAPHVMSQLEKYFVEHAEKQTARLWVSVEFPSTFINGVGKVFFIVSEMTHERHIPQPISFLRRDSSHIEQFLFCFRRWCLGFGGCRVMRLQTITNKIVAQSCRH